RRRLRHRSPAKWALQRALRLSAPVRSYFVSHSALQSSGPSVQGRRGHRSPRYHPDFASQKSETIPAYPKRHSGGAVTGAFPSPAKSRFHRRGSGGEFGPNTPALTTAGSLTWDPTTRLLRHCMQVFLFLGLYRAGGAEGARTPDLDTASVALSQLSYSPTNRTVMVSDSQSSFHLPYHC